MIDIFLYNENMCFVNVNLAGNYDIFDGFIYNDFRIRMNYFVDDFYFDSKFFQNTKRAYHSGNNVVDLRGYLKKKVYFFFEPLSTHKLLLKKSLISLKVHKLMSLIGLDGFLKKFMMFVNYTQSNQIFFYEKKKTYGDLFYIWIGKVDPFFFEHTFFYFNYYTLFDFKKFVMGMSRLDFHIKFGLGEMSDFLYEFGPFFKSREEDAITADAMYYYFPSVFGELFGLSRYVGDVYYTDLGFILDHYDFKSFGVFLHKDTFFDYTIFTPENFKHVRESKPALISEGRGTVYYNYNQEFFRFKSKGDSIKLDIFLNYFNYLNELFFIQTDYFRFNNINDASISNIHLYSRRFLSHTYSLEILESSLMVNVLYLKKFKNITYKILIEQDNIFFTIKNYFLLKEHSFETKYFMQFYNNINIVSFIYFFVIKFAIKKLILFLILLLVVFISIFFIYIEYYYKFVLDFIKKILKNFFLKVILLKLNKILMLFLLFLNFKFKNTKYFFNKNFIIDVNGFNKLNNDLLNFDLIVFIFNKFIIDKYGYKFYKNYNLLKSEYIFSNTLILLNKYNNKFLLNNFFFLLLIYFHFLILIIYILFYYLNFFVLVILYRLYYIEYIDKFNGVLKFTINIDGSERSFGTFYYTMKGYYRYIKSGLIYFKNFKLFQFLVKSFSVFKINEQKTLHNFYIHLSNAIMLLYGNYPKIFIAFLHKFDHLNNFRFFFASKLYRDRKYALKESELNIIYLNLFNFINVLEFKLGKFFLNLNLFKLNENIYILDYNLLNLLKKQQKNYISSNFFFNLEFEKLILNPLKFLFKIIFINNILFSIIICTSFVKCLKLEIYLKFIFIYFFNCIYVFYFLFFNYNSINILNLKYLYFSLIFLNKIKYFILFIFEIFINKLLLKIFTYVNKLKYLFIFIFIFFYILNINILDMHLFFNSFFFSQSLLYIYLVIFELMYYIFENLLIQNFFNLILNSLDKLLIGNNNNDYFFNYKIFVKFGLKILNDYYFSFDTTSIRKAYGINFQLLMFNEYKDSFYAGIPYSFAHTFVRVIYITIYNKLPEFGFYGLQYFSYFYRLSGDLLGLYTSKGNKYSVIGHLIYGFFNDSFYHKYYIGFEFTHLLYYYNCFELKEFFRIKGLFGIFYFILYGYFLVEFIYLNLCYNFIYLFYFIFNNIIEFFINFFIDFFKNIIGILYLIYYINLYFYNLYLYILFEKLYIILYTFFFIKIIFNLFLFLYNFLIYYQETLYSFLNMDIDFIKQNIFNAKYRLTEDAHSLGVGPTHFYKFEQYTGIDNLYKESFMRNLFFYEFRNLYFFKTFYSFYMDINRITFFIFFIYLYSFFRILQYLFSIINKGFFFTFFNNDGSTASNPIFTGDRGTLYTKTKSYYFNEGFNHIIGGNFLTNYYYYNSNNINSYVYSQKKKTLYLDQINYLERKENILNKFNNNFLFTNQRDINKYLVKQNILKDNFVNGYINSFIFFKNYQFLGYKNLDYVIIKYESIYGSYSRSGVENSNKNFIKTLWFDKYNYLCLPAYARLTYTHLFTKNGLLYKDFAKNKRYVNLNKNYKILNILKKNLLIFSYKNLNFFELFENRLQYPFLMFGLTTKDLNVSKNSNLKYLFPLLIPKKEIGLLYNDLFVLNKENIEKNASVPMSGEGLVFFNKSLMLPYFSILSRIDCNLSYNESNYKGIGSSITSMDRDLFTNYKGGETRLVKSPNFSFITFYKDFDIMEEFELNYYTGLRFINKRYFNYYIPVFHTGSGLSIPKVYEQNLFQNLKLNSNYDGYDVESMRALGTLEYFPELQYEDPTAPYTNEEGHSIFQNYVDNSFFKGEDDVFLMVLHSEYNITDFVGKVNFISSFLFFFIPLYTYIIGSEVYQEVSGGFVYEGNLRQPIETNVVYAMEYYLSMADFDMQDERYFYINVIEQEMFDTFVRFYHEIFYNFTKYFNTFDYLNTVKKNTILFNDDMLLNKLRQRRMYHNIGRLFKSYIIDETDPEDYIEERPAGFFMQESKFFYIFSDLSYNVPFFFNINNNNKNLFLLFYNYNYIKDAILKLAGSNGMYIPDIFKFFLRPHNFLEPIPFDLFINNLFDEQENLTNLGFFFLKKLNNNSYFFFNIENYFNKFYFYYFTKNKEYTSGFDKYFLGHNHYLRNTYIIKNKYPNKLVKPFFLYNSYMDAVGPTMEMYGSDSVELLRDVVAFHWGFERRAIGNSEVGDIIIRHISHDRLKDYSLNFTPRKYGIQSKKSFGNRFRSPIRLYGESVLDIDGVKKIEYLPITSKYIYGFQLDYILLDKSYLRLFLKSYDVINFNSNIYIDKSTTLTDRSKIGQFQLSLSELRNFLFFPIIEFLLLLLLLFGLFIFFFIFLGFFKFEYILFKKRTINLYYDKVNDIGIYFEYKKINKPNNNSITLKDEKNED